MLLTTLPRLHSSLSPQNTFDGLGLARKLLRSIPAAALATLARGTSFPFATLTAVATDSDGAPILLLSDLAHHTMNLRADPRGSLLLSQGGKGDPLAHPRLTLVGRLAPTPDARARARFLRRHPEIGALRRVRGFLLLAARAGGRPSQRRICARRRLSGRRSARPRRRRRRAVRIGGGASRGDQRPAA